MSSEPFVRSPELLARDDSGLLVVDMQDKLLGLVPGSARVTWNVRRLVDGAGVLGVPVAGTEQYPQGLGPTTADLATRLGPLPAKVAFSCASCRQVLETMRERGVVKLLVVGIETHVCVQQTVFDLLAEGFRVYVAVDAVAARHAIDHDTALRRMETGGAILTTTESALFEWCAVAGTPEFKRISALVREAAPAEV